MFQTAVLVRQDPATVPRLSRTPHRQVSRGGILDVLDRASRDNQFVAQLTHHGPEALAQYDLTWQEKAALLSGDIRWIEAHVGKLNAQQRTWLECRLEQEIW
jgi:hypothetical protein